MMKANSWTVHKATQTMQVDIGGRFHLNIVGIIRRLATLDIGIAFMPEETNSQMAGYAAFCRSGRGRPGPSTRSPRRVCFQPGRSASSNFPESG
jgi:hypothetical protein